MQDEGELSEESSMSLAHAHSSVAQGAEDMVAAMQQKLAESERKVRDLELSRRASELQLQQQQPV